MSEDSKTTTTIAATGDQDSTITSASSNDDDTIPSNGDDTVTSSDDDTVTSSDDDTVTPDDDDTVTPNDNDTVTSNDDDIATMTAIWMKTLEYWMLSRLLSCRDDMFEFLLEIDMVRDMIHRTERFLRHKKGSGTRKKKKMKLTNDVNETNNTELEPVKRKLRF